MKTLLIVLAACLLAGCASHNGPRRSESEDDLIPVVQAKMTVDEFVEAIGSGKTMKELEGKLGVPIVSNMTLRYWLADGTVSRRLKGSELVVRRKGSDKELRLETGREGVSDADVRRRLEEIKKRHNLIHVEARGEGATVVSGMMTAEHMKAIESEIQDVMGRECKVVFLFK